MTQEEAIKFVKQMYKSVWQSLNIKEFEHYYSPSVIGHSGDTQINYDDIKKHILNLKKTYRELVPDFHRILSTGNQITVWFTQHGIDFDGKELLALETMLTYEVIENKINAIWFVWNIDASEFFNVKTHPEKFTTQEKTIEKFNLTKRELEVLYYLIRYFNMKEIAKVLNISNRTIETHIVHIKNKFKVNTIEEVIAFTTEHGYAMAVPQLMDLAIKKGLIKAIKY